MQSCSGIKEESSTSTSTNTSCRHIRFTRHMPHFTLPDGFGSIVNCRVKTSFRLVLDPDEPISTRRVNWQIPRP